MNFTNVNIVTATSNPFAGVRALIIDMDGVLWHGSRPVPGLKDFFRAVRKAGLPFILATNNASNTPRQYVSKLAGMGVEVDASQILTSGVATAFYLADSVSPQRTKIYIIGEEGLRQPLMEQGFTLTGSHKETSQWQADIVVVGKDETLTWDKLATATLNINAGARFIGTNADTTLPMELGISHGNGAILAALEAATHKKPTIIGKPEPILYQQAMDRLGVNPAETLAIGDRLETDILGAINAGMRSLLVLSGISSQEDVEKSDYKPDAIMADIQAVTQALVNLTEEEKS